MSYISTEIFGFSRDDGYRLRAQIKPEPVAVWDADTCRRVAQHFLDQAAELDRLNKKEEAPMI